MNGAGPIYRNSVLNALGLDIVRRLQLLPIRFELQHQIEIPGTSIKRLFFIEDGMACMTTNFRDGSQVDVGMFGYESVIGVSALMGIKRSLNHISTQIAGSGYCCPIQVAKEEFSRGEAFQKLILSYVQTQLVGAAQSAGCHARHTVDQRLARWLLACSDRTHCKEFRLSHEFLADMLGSSRPTVSLAANTLRKMDLIHYQRGLLTIVDSPGLEQMACECYSTIKNHLENNLDNSITGPQHAKSSPTGWPLCL
jgi:CRP-like cAMP-binding protein